MLVDSRIVSACSFSLGLSAGSWAQDGGDRRPLSRETHIHTAYSFDAYSFNTHVLAICSLRKALKLANFGA